MIAGVATRDIAAPAGEAIGGYWGRTLDGCKPCRDGLSARVLFVEEGGSAILIVALDLIGVTAEFAAKLQKAARDAALASPTPFKTTATAGCTRSAACRLA